TLQWQRARKSEGDPLPPEPLTLAGAELKANETDDEKKKGIGKYVVKPNQAYGITLDRLRSNGQPVLFLDGDQIVVSISVTLQEPDPATPPPTKSVTRSLSARATVVPRPIIAPPPAVYSLVTFDPDRKPVAARAALHATAPLPQRVEFPQLLVDLAAGHIR